MMVAAQETRLIESGFAAFVAAQAPLHPDLALDLRIAFYAGAQHMFSSMVRMSRGQSERLSLQEIEGEIEQFASECLLRNVPVAGNG